MIILKVYKRKRYWKRSQLNPVTPRGRHPCSTCQKTQTTEVRADFTIPIPPFQPHRLPIIWVCVQHLRAAYKGICPDTISLHQQPRPGRCSIHAAPHSVHAWLTNPRKTTLTGTPVGRKRGPHFFFFNVWRPCECMQIRYMGQMSKEGFVCTSLVLGHTPTP